MKKDATVSGVNLEMRMEMDLSMVVLMKAVRGAVTAAVEVEKVAAVVRVGIVV